MKIENRFSLHHLPAICPKMSCLTFVNFNLFFYKIVTVIAPGLLTAQCCSSEVGDQRPIILITTKFGFAGAATHGPPRVTGKILYT